jgi:hypothetical protein
MFFSKGVNVKMFGGAPKVRVPDTYQINPSFSEVQAYNPEIFYFFTEDLTPANPSHSPVENLIQLFQIANLYNIPVKVEWTLLGATYNPPSNPQTQYYYAPDQDPGSEWGLPITSNYWITSTVTTASVNWPGLQNAPLWFNSNGECVTVEAWLAEDNLFGNFSPMTTIGGVRLLSDSRKYRISLDPTKGAAWCIKRTISLDNSSPYFFSGLSYGINTWEIIYYFATGYAADLVVPGSLIANTYTQTTGSYPSSPTGGQPTGGWSGEGSAGVLEWIP